MALIPAAVVVTALVALLASVDSQAHPAIMVGGGSYGCNCPMLNAVAARQCCATVGTCCFAGGLGLGAYGQPGYGGFGYPGLGYGQFGHAQRRPFIGPRPLLPLAQGGIQLNIGAGLG